MNDILDNSTNPEDWDLRDIPEDWKWLPELIERLLRRLGFFSPMVTIQCVQGVCVVDPETIPVRHSQNVRFRAIGTNAHIFNPNRDLSPVNHLVIPRGETRLFPVSPSAKPGSQYPYIVYCEACGLNCPGPGPDTPKMIVR